VQKSVLLHEPFSENHARGSHHGLGERDDNSASTLRKILAAKNVGLLAAAYFGAWKKSDCL
jgi:hypothetical protein